MCEQQDFYFNFAKSALYLALATMSDKTINYQSRQHAQKLQSIGVDSLVITIKGIPDSGVCVYEFYIPSGNYL